MRSRRVLVAASVMLMAGGALMAATAPSTNESIHSLLWGRRDRGGNSYPKMVDPPLWPETRFLLEGESATTMLALLDKLLSEDVAKTMPDTRARALLQHELWQVFDWTTEKEFAPEARVALRKRLATAIARLALTKREIEALPGNVAWGAEGSPPKIDEQAGWLSLGVDSKAVAEGHMKGLGGRSAFGVFFNHPEGVPAAEAYLRRLAEMPFPPTRRPRDAVRTRQPPPGTPFMQSPLYAADPARQFPVGTKVALVRRMVLIDTEGKMICSPIVESVQVRTFLKIEADLVPDDVREQEFVLDRERYLAGEKAALSVTGADEGEPPVFRAHGSDWFEERFDNVAYRKPQPTLESCIGCHRDSGVLAMNSYTGAFTGPGNPELKKVNVTYQAQLTDVWKREQASWGMLRAYWEAGGK